MPIADWLKEGEIIAACNGQDGRYQTGCLAYPSDAPRAFIKYGYERFGMMAQMRNQKFLWQAFQQMPEQQNNDIRVPEIYDVFENDGMVYIVMEYVHGQTLEALLDNTAPDDLQRKYNQITRAIKLFLSIKVPDDATPGPVKGGFIKHPIFKDAVAPVKYNSVGALQQHMNKVANYFKRNNLNIDFSQENLCFCFSDLHARNFIFTNNGCLYIVDFDHASFLPISFMTYALKQPLPICTAIRDNFKLPEENLEAMQAAAYYFMVSSRKVGLPDEMVGDVLFTYNQ